MNDLAEVYFLETFSHNSFEACRTIAKDAVDVSENVGKLLIKQFIHEQHGVDIGEVYNTNQGKFDWAVIKSLEYFRKDKIN